MRNAKTYMRKIRKLLAQLRKASTPSIPPGPERVQALLRGILQADATRRAAEQAIQALVEEYVDLNELRVSPAKDIVDCLGRDFPCAREKAEVLTTVLNNVFARTNDISVDFLDAVPKRELRRHLLELGLEPYAAAYAAMTLFGLPALPVDRTLTECLKMDGYVAPGSDIGHVQAFLERIVAPKDIPAAHEALRIYAEKQAKVLARKRPAEPSPAAEQAPARPPASATDVQAQPPPAAELPRKPPAKSPKASKAPASTSTGPKRQPAAPQQEAATKKAPSRKQTRKR